MARRKQNLGTIYISERLQECLRPISHCALTRKQIDKLLGDVEVQSGNKAYWFKTDDAGNIAGGVAKFVQEKKEALTQALGLAPDTLVVLTTGKLLSAQKTAGVVSPLGLLCMLF